VTVNVSEAVSPKEDLGAFPADLEIAKLRVKKISSGMRVCSNRPRKAA